MSWWGKLAGGAFGFMFGGPIGALVGVALGHHVDRGMSNLRDEQSGVRLGSQERVQMAFFTATFSVMGHLAKSDGRVSEKEIAAAQGFMTQMGLDAARRQVAIRLFNEGKQPDFPLDGVLDQFKKECRRRDNLIQMFLEIQLHAAYADGALHRNEKEILFHICRRLGIAPAQYRRLEAMVRAQQRFAGAGAGGRQRVAQPQRRDVLKDAYAALGIAENASNDEVKRAYRRLMNQHHPDKLVAKGLPEEMMKLAEEKTHEIRSAYDRIKEARGM